MDEITQAIEDVKFLIDAYSQLIRSKSKFQFRNEQLRSSCEIALKALESKRIGFWETAGIEYGYVECPFCKAKTSVYLYEGVEELHFCFNCGAELKTKKEDKNEII